MSKRNKQAERVKVDCRLVRDTTAAQLIEVSQLGKTRLVWIPKSQIWAYGDDCLIITAFIAKQKDLLKGEY